MSRMLGGVLMAALGGTAMVFSSPAHADANSYLQYIQDHHINVGISNPSKQLWMGQWACQSLHDGMSPDQIAATPTIFDVPGIIDAAQHELCPDTLVSGQSFTIAPTGFKEDPASHVVTVGLQGVPALQDPAFCYSTGQWIPNPEISGYCPDGEAPFNGPGPSYGGGIHRWPDGSDD